MHSKRNTEANFQEKANETKEKRRKLDHIHLDFHEDCENFVNFCEKNSYECIYGKAKPFKILTSSSNSVFSCLKYTKYF